MARLSNLRAAKPERASQIEGMLVNMARSGRISGKMNDEQFRGLLDQISSGQAQKKTTVKVSFLLFLLTEFIIRNILV